MLKTSFYIVICILLFLACTEIEKPKKNDLMQQSCYKNYAYHFNPSWIYNGFDSTNIYSTTNKKEQIEITEVYGWKYYKLVILQCKNYPYVVTKYAWQIEQDSYSTKPYNNVHKIHCPTKNSKKLLLTELKKIKYPKKNIRNCIFSPFFSKNYIYVCGYSINLLNKEQSIDWINKHPETKILKY